jgi:hypothetical protein
MRRASAAMLARAVANASTASSASNATSSHTAETEAANNKTHFGFQTVTEEEKAQKGTYSAIALPLLRMRALCHFLNVKSCVPC